MSKRRKNKLVNTIESSDVKLDSLPEEPDNNIPNIDVPDNNVSTYKKFVENRSPIPLPIDNKIESSSKEDFYVLIAGSRTYDNYNIVSKYIDTEFAIANINPELYNIIIVQGEADGVDMLAKRYAVEHNYQCKCFPAQWNVYGNSAGFIRNEKMHQFIANHPNRLCICFKYHLSNGKGTTHSIELGKRYKNNVVFYNIEENDNMKRDFYNNFEG